MAEIGIHLFIGFRGFDLEEDLKHLIREYRPGGIVLFRRNIESRGQLKNLITSAQAMAMAELGRPLYFAIDEEGGTVQRLTPHFGSIPSARSLAKQGTEAVAHWAAVCAANLAEIGIHINFAPVLDMVGEETNHFMESRSFGSIPEQVSNLGNIWIESHQAKGISCTAKHFPGLGPAELDPHHFSPVIAAGSEENFRSHLIPFRSAINAGVNCVMSSHAVYRSVDCLHPATLSQEICCKWLRERLGFGGILFADDLDMAAICENYSPEETAFLGLSCSTDFFLLCQKSESVEPMHRALSDQLAANPSLGKFHQDTIRRIERLRRFHFPDPA